MYFILERFSSSPIVYLRSFHHTGAATAYGRIVARAARSFGVVVAIVHESQPGSTLMRHTSVLDQPQVARVADKEWRDWVCSQLARASAVVIDATVLTESVHWELGSAKSALPAKKIAVLVERGTKVETPGDITRIEYALDEESARDAVEELKGWFGQAIASDPTMTTKT